MAGEVTKPLRVDGTDLLDENASRSATDVDFGPKRRRLGARRRWCHQHNRPREERIGLHNDAKAAPSLFVAHAFGGSQGKDVTPAHEGAP
jgi:hypothetical protein